MCGRLSRPGIVRYQVPIKYLHILNNVNYADLCTVLSYIFLSYYLCYFVYDVSYCISSAVELSPRVK